MMDQDDNLIKERKITDESIYLSVYRHQEPKELFKFTADQITVDTTNKSLLDLGCSTGEFLYYLKERFPKLELHGLDISKKMIDFAETQVPGVKFHTGSILDSEFFTTNKFDFTVCVGVLSIFDDIEPPLKNIISSLNPGGTALIATIVNDDPIDTIVRYKDARIKDAQPSSGWNIVSKKTIEDVLARQSSNLNLEFLNFKLPFSMPKREDPMRTWTIRTESNEHQIVNGACQLINIKVIKIVKQA